AQANTVAVDRFGIVQSAKVFKDFLVVLGGNAGTVVAYPDAHRIGLRLAASTALITVLGLGIAPPLPEGRLQTDLDPAPDRPAFPTAHRAAVNSSSPRRR